MASLAVTGVWAGMGRGPDSVVTGTSPTATPTRPAGAPSAVRSSTVPSGSDSSPPPTAGLGQAQFTLSDGATAVVTDPDGTAGPAPARVVVRGPDGTALGRGEGVRAADLPSWQRLLVKDRLLVWGVLDPGITRVETQVERDAKVVSSR